MSEFNCSRCNKDLYKILQNGGAIFPIDSKGTYNRRWVCNECVDRKEISVEVFDITNDISRALNNKNIKIHKNN